MKKGIFIVSLTGITFAACKKEDTKASCPATMAGLAGTYSLVKVEQGANGTYTDVTTTYTQPCQRDNKLTLYADSTYKYEDAGTVCTFNESDSSTWEIDAGGKLNIGAVGPFILDDLTISSFDCNNLVTTADFGTVSGIAVTTRFTFRK
jgi:hypothetical protein